MFRYEELSTLRRLILFKKLIASGGIKVVSGAIASFVTKRAGKAISVLDSIEPIQDLHGYDKPWSGGNGVNKLNLDANVTVLSGVVSSAVTITSGDGSATITENYYNRDNNKFGWAFNVESNQTYTVSGKFTSSNHATIKIYATDGSVVYEDIVLSSATTFSFSFNSDTNTTLYFYATITSWGQTITLNNVQIEKGSSVTTYSPYSNICPISGRTEVVTSRCGKNLYSREGSEYNVPVYAQDGSQSSYADVAVWWIKVKPNTKYTCSLKQAPSLSTYIRWINCDKNKGFISRPAASYPSSNLPVTITTPNNTEWVQIAVNEYPTAQISSNDWELQIEENTTATDYEAFDGHTYTTDLGRTVYGGTLDVVSGVLTVDRAYYAFNGTEDWFKSGSALNGYYTYHLRDRVSEDAKAKAFGTAISDKFEYTNNATVYFQNYGKFYVDNAFNFNVNPSEGATDVASFKTWLSTTPVEVCYELATPQTYQLTPTEVALLLGTNNVWTDCGEVEVTYKG